MLQGKGSSYFDYGLSVNKSFFDKRLTLSAFASNFFKKYMDNTNTLEACWFYAGELEQVQPPALRHQCQLPYRRAESQRQESRPFHQQ